VVLGSSPILATKFSPIHEVSEQSYIRSILNQEVKTKCSKEPPVRNLAVGKLLWHASLAANASPDATATSLYVLRAHVGSFRSTGVYTLRKMRGRRAVTSAELSSVVKRILLTGLLQIHTRITRSDPGTGIRSGISSR